MESKSERSERLLREFEQSPGVLYSRARDLHRTSVYVFTENGRVLIGALKSFRSYVAFPGLAEREETNRQHREIIRHLQNFVMSAMALVDASRVWRDKLQSSHPEFCVEYDGRLAMEFKAAQDHLFIKYLRNYMVHRSLPVTASRGTFTLSFKLAGGEEEGRLEWAVVLDLDELRRWSGWSATTKQYLAAATEDIELLSIVEPYWLRVTKFYDWFHETLAALHKADVEESERMHKELNALEGG